MNTNINTSAQAIIDTIRSFGAETDEEIISTLEDGEALAYMGITDADQEAVEDAYVLLRTKVKKAVPIGIHNGNTFDAIALPTIFSVTIIECDSTKVRSVIIRDVQSRDAAVQAAVKKVYGKAAAFLEDIHRSTPWMIYGEAEVALYGRARALSTGTLWIKINEMPSSVSIGSTTFTANRTARSIKAVSTIARVKENIEAMGFEIDTKGPSAGQAGSFHVYIYPTAVMHQVGDKNRAADAAYIFSVQYMRGSWFASPTAVAEAMAFGLKCAINALGASVVAA